MSDKAKKDLAELHVSKKPVYVYVAGPLTTGDFSQNVANAIKVANMLMELGFQPFVPHTSAAAWKIVNPERGWKEWMEYDLAWVKHCDALIRFPGESRGADVEEEFCRQNDIPFYVIPAGSGPVVEFYVLLRVVSQMAEDLLLTR